jgi:hypothetical protein
MRHCRKPWYEASGTTVDGNIRQLLDVRARKREGVRTYSTVTDDSLDRSGRDIGDLVGYVAAETGTGKGGRASVSGGGGGG